MSQDKTIGMTTLYGIKNCDTVKKARQWLDSHGVAYRFHDLRADDLDEASLHTWSKQLGWESLLNRRSTTWRQLADRDKENLSETSAIRLMLEQPTLIKRPVLDREGSYNVGFNEAEYKKFFG